LLHGLIIELGEVAARDVAVLHPQVLGS